ncbi:MAG: molybdopterin-binding protein [Pseudomonadota bacterium]
MSDSGATQPTAAMLVIGDEILSGRTKDTNSGYLADLMTEHGVELREIRVVPDEQDVIVAAVNEIRTRVDHLFTSGGIGPTHDDITADCVAAAFGVNIDVRADARAILEEGYRATGREINEARLRMARIPDTAVLIPNPVSWAPGFTIGNVHVMAGVPAVFKEMLAHVASTIQGGPLKLSHAFRCEIGEGDLAGPLGGVQAAFPDVSMGSYPYGNGAGAILILRHTDRNLLGHAADALRKALVPLGGAKSETPPG